MVYPQLLQRSLFFFFFAGVHVEKMLIWKEIYSFLQRAGVATIFWAAGLSRVNFTIPELKTHWPCPGGLQELMLSVCFPGEELEGTAHGPQGWRVSSSPRLLSGFLESLWCQATHRLTEVTTLTMLLVSLWSGRLWPQVWDTSLWGAYPCPVSRRVCRQAVCCCSAPLQRQVQSRHGRGRECPV